jgi:AraC-like DNA-binding protein
VSWFVTAASPPALARVLACSWTAVPTGVHRLVPDGCPDLLWISNGSVILCGPEERAWTFSLPAGLVAAGVRFRPGAISSLLGLDVSTIRNTRLPWSAFTSAAEQRALAESISCAIAQANGDLSAGASVLAEQVRRLAITTGPVDPFADDVLDALTAAPSLSQSALAVSIGLSPRQLHRRALRLFGYGTSTLARLLRLQRVLAVVSTCSPDLPLAHLALAAGYSDQSHFTRDCRAITGLPPAAFLAEYVPTFPDMSDPFKTSTPLVAMVMA